MLCQLSNYALRSILMNYNTINTKNVYVSRIDKMEKYQLITCIKSLSKLFPHKTAN